MPGPRNPGVTPYMIPFVRAAGTAKRVVMVCGAQMGKTDSILDLIGQRLDQHPGPLLYVGPSRDFVTQQFEPRVADLLETPALRDKMASARRQKLTKKIVAGVPLRLAHAGSSTALKSDPASLALVDEYDEMLSNIKGQGDPLGLIEARGFTYADFSTVITSTPSQGNVETVTDEATGLEFWKHADLEELSSAIWRLWQQGTRYHWAWQCPHCDEWFIPRSKLLSYPKGATPAEAKRNAWISCPHNGCVIDEVSRLRCNETGVYVAPGQRITKAGKVVGDPPDSPTISFWVSGLASPFVTLGDRAQNYLLALKSGESDKIQTSINADMGETYIAGGGEMPAVSEVKARRTDYQLGKVPAGGLRLTMAVDVQKFRLIYGIRAWGAFGTSWLIAQDEIHGDTSQIEPWNELDEVLDARISGMRIELCFVDSGFRPGDPKIIDVNRVYEFCRTRAPRVFATKGSLTLAAPLIRRQIEVTSRGKRAGWGLSLISLSTDHWKRQVYDVLRHDPDDGGAAWFLPDDVSDEYCEQVVSEARKIAPNGKPQWLRVRRENHALDIEAMLQATAFMKGFHKLRPSSRARVAANYVEPIEDEGSGTAQAPQTSIPAPAIVAAVRPRSMRSFNRLNGGVK
jgi:phage terminase large subunit GpA-like protein